jgi:hypothetical protein
VSFILYVDVSLSLSLQGIFSFKKAWFRKRNLFTKRRFLSISEHIVEFLKRNLRFARCNLTTTMRLILVNCLKACSCLCSFMLDDVVIRFFFTIIINFVNIEIWFELWFIFDFVMQCMNFFCNFFVMNIKSIVLWNDAFLKKLCLKEEWIWIAFVERRLEIDLSRCVEMILSRHFIKNDADWSFLIKCVFRRRSNSLWQSLWRLARCVSCKSWVKHYKHCAHWLIYCSSFWYE